MTEANEKRYDEIPYESHPFEESHPRWLATVAAIFGLKTPPPESARILELGCAGGGNLVPMAETLPNSTCLGIDLSSRQIEDGKAFIKATGLTNVELRQESIANVDASYGQFDYIICHGVFSWVTREVQQKIFEVCRDRLAPNGIAYISYNTLPGWHMKGMLRDMMRFHANRFKDPKAQIAQSRALLNVLAKTVPSEGNAFGMMLKQESEALRKHSDYYIYHEHLELENDPLYFHEFAERAFQSGLQFLGEAGVRSMLTDQLPPDVQAALREVATNIIYGEQYMDFFRNRTFRQTLLCHKDVKLNRHLNTDTFSQFNFASSLKPQIEDFDVKSQDPLVFHAPGWPAVTITGPAWKATMLSLADAWPEYLPLDRLERTVRERLSAHSAYGRESSKFVDTMGTWFTKGIASISLLPPPCVSRVSERPKAGVVARTQASKGLRTLTNSLHKMVRVTDFDASVVELLDGSNDSAGLTQRLEGWRSKDSSPLETRVDTCLKVLAKAGFLQA